MKIAVIFERHKKISKCVIEFINFSELDNFAFGTSYTAGKYRFSSTL